MSGSMIYSTLSKAVLLRGTALVTQGLANMGGATGSGATNVINVGPTRVFHTLADVLNETIAPNTTILLDAGTYNAAVQLPNSLDPSTIIQGTVVNGQLATILDFQGGNEAGHTLAGGGKGGLFITGPMTLDSLWVKNAGGPAGTNSAQGDGGEAGVRPEAFPARGTLTLNNVAFDGNANGLFIGALGNNVDLVCNNCNFDFITSNGQSRDGYGASLFSQGRTVTLNNCSSPGNIYGNTFKFLGNIAAGGVTINGGTICAGLGGAALVRGQGGPLTINGGRISATVPGQKIISYAEEGTADTPVDVYITNATIVACGATTIANGAAGTTLHFVNCAQEWYGTNPTLAFTGAGSVVGLATSGSSMAANPPAPAQPTYPANGGPGSVNTTPSGGNTGTTPSQPSVPPLTTIGSGPDVFTLILSEDYYLADAQFVLLVDNIQQGGTQTVVAQRSAKQTQKFAFMGTFGTGAHTVTVKFTNDAYSGTAAGGDRNLYIESVIYNGATVVGSEFAVMNAAPATFQVAATNTGTTTGGTAPAGSTAMGPLKVSTTNGRYFAKPNGSAVYLAGSHTWPDLQDLSPTATPVAFDYTGFLNYIASLGNNLFRLWAWETAITSGGTSSYANPNVYQQPGPGVIPNTTLPKFDTTQFNQAYFDRMLARVQQAQSLGIWVSVMLFQGFDVVQKPGTAYNAWLAHPYNVNNNINGVNGDPSTTGSGAGVQSLNLPSILALQKAYVAKVIDTLNGQPNVLYEVCNEAQDDSGTWAWQNAIADYIKSYQSSKPNQHPVGITAAYPASSTTNSNLRTSHADWVSYSGLSTDDYKINQVPADGAKVSILDTDHVYGDGGDAFWPWKSFTRGHNVLLMDSFTSKNFAGLGAGNTSGAATEDACRLGAKGTLIAAGLVDMAGMVPHGELSSTGFCLANPGTAYIVVTSSASFTLDLSAVPSTTTLSATWVNVNTAATQAGTSVKGGSATTAFTAPWANAGLVLTIGSATVTTGGGTGSTGGGGTVPTNPTATTGPTGSPTLAGGATGTITLTNYVVQDNFGGGLFAGIRLNNSNLSTNGGQSLTINDPSGYFRLGNDGGYLDFNTGKGLPPIGSYTFSISCTNGSQSITQSFVVNSVYEAPPSSISFTPGRLSSSNNPGTVVGTATAVDADNIYVWSLANSANGAFFINSKTGVVTTNATLTAQTYNITIQVMDGTANKTYQQTFQVPVTSGNVIASSAMAISVTPGITNAANGSGNGGSVIGLYPGVIATPSIDTSLFTNGTPTWSLVQSLANKFAIDPRTGVVTAAKYLPAMTETITISVSDGVNSCTNTAQVVVNWAQGPTVHVGPGQTYAHMDDLYGAMWNDSSGGNGAKWDGTTIMVHPGTDANYYVNDLFNLPARGQTFHPVKIIGVGQGSGPRPLFGFGAGYYGKAIFDAKGIDFSITYIEIAGATAYSNSNIAGVFKDAGGGNIWMDDMSIHNCDNAFQGGDAFDANGPAFDLGVNFYLTNSEIAMCCSGMPGRTHNMYFGLADSVTLNNVLSWGAEHGHEFKSRCGKTTLLNSRFLDTEIGHGSAQVDVPIGGELLVDGCFFHKGPGAEAIWSLHYGGEWDNKSQFRWVNNATVQNSIFVNHATPASCGGNPWAIVNNGVVSPITGQYGTLTAINNKFFGYIAGNTVVGNDTYNKVATPVVEQGTVMLASSPALDLTHPTTGAVPTPPMPFLYEPSIDIGTHELRISRSTGVGTTIATATWPSTAQVTRPAPQWSLLNNAGGKYSIDGSGNIKVAGALSAGVDIIQVQSASNWANWFFVVVV